MVRRLDPVTRRRAIAEAVLAIVAREGLDAATVRDVAREAGVSAGMVQHHFRTRDEMLQFACEYMVERTSGKTQNKVLMLPAPRGGREVLRTIFEEMLPLDDERRIGIRVWMAFLARAVVEPPMAAFMRATHVNTHRMIAGILADERSAGRIAPDADVDRATIRLFALVDGLVSHVLLEHYTGEEALRAIDDALDRVFRT